MNYSEYFEIDPNEVKLNDVISRRKFITQKEFNEILKKADEVMPAVYPSTPGMGHGSFINIVSNNKLMKIYIGMELVGRTRITKDWVVRTVIEIISEEILKQE